MREALCVKRKMGKQQNSIWIKKVKAHPTQLPPIQLPPRHSRRFYSGIQVGRFFDKAILMNGSLGELFDAGFRACNLQSRRKTQVGEA